MALAVISHVSSPPRWKGCALLANGTCRQPLAPHPCPCSPHWNYSASGLPCPCIPTSRQPPALFWSPRSQNIAGQDTTFLFSRSVPWSDSWPPWQCSYVVGQDAPSWKHWIFGLTKSKAGTSMKTSHAISVTHDTLLPPSRKKQTNKHQLWGLFWKTQQPSEQKPLWH